MTIGHISWVLRTEDAYDALEALEHWRDELRDEIAPASVEAGDAESAESQHELAATMDRLCVSLLSLLEFEKAAS